MDLKVQLKDMMQEGMKVDAVKFQKMLLLFNAVEQGWTARKRGDAYVFTKSHEGIKEVLEESYLMKFVKTNLDLGKVLGQSA